MIGLPSGGNVDTSNFVTKTELFDIETTTTEPGCVKGDSMYVGKAGYDFRKKRFLTDQNVMKAYFYFEGLTEQEDIWSYSYFGDYCYMEITTSNNTSVYGWFAMYKDGTVVMTSENLSANQISLEYRTDSRPSGLLIFVDDQNITYSYSSYTVNFYKCTYTAGGTTTTTTIKESLLPTISGGGGVSIQYLTQAEYNALQTKDPNTLYLIEESV